MRIIGGWLGSGMAPRIGRSMPAIGRWIRVGRRSPAVDLTGIPVGSVSSFDLVGLGSVSRTGSTGLRLHLSGGQPCG